MKIKWTLLFFSACALSVVTNVASARDWPQWRGANRDGKAADFTPPKTWPKELAQKWKVDVGEGVACPSLAGDKLYVFSRQEGGEITRCLDAASGKEIWKDKYDAMGATGPASGFSGPRATPTVADGKVITLGIRGVLSCLNAADGKVIWRKDEIKGYPRFFTSSSPLVADGLCIAELGGSDNGCIVAYQLADGKEKWKWSGDTPGYASPVLMEAGGTKLVIAMTDTKLVGLTLSDGKAVWEMPFVVLGRGYNAATPIVDGDKLFVTGSGRGVTALKLEKNGDAFVSKELWKDADDSVMFNTPVLKNGLIFGLSMGNDIFCINAKDGKSAWKAPASGSSSSSEGNSGGGGGRGMRGGGRGGYGSIVDAGSVMLALTPSAELIAFEPNEKAYKEIARIKVAQGSTYAYPVVSGNRIFTKDQDSVVLWTVQ